MNRLAAHILAVVLSIPVLAGCGGSQSSSPQTGRVAFTVVWPERSRLIPAAANSIKVTLTDSTGAVLTRVMARPAQGGQSTAAFDTLPLGNATAEAVAFPNTDGTGVPQAQASAIVTVVANTTTPLTLTMASTIDRMEISPSTPTVVAGQRIQLTPTARDAAGRIVLISPAMLGWQSSNQTIATVDGSGLVTGAAAGDVQVTVTETESGKRSSVTVTVTPAIQPPPPDPLSKSKISIHLIGNYTDGAKQIVQAAPRVLKLLDLGGNMRAALTDYKSRYPTGKTVLRIFTRVRYSISDDPAASAQDFWTQVLSPPISQLPQSERNHIDYLEGPNEGDSTPSWASTADAQWLGRFWATLAPIIKNNGFKPCVGSIPVGNPGGSQQQMEDMLEAFVPALTAASAAGGAWSYHSYTLDYSTDPNVESWTSLRYRRYYDFLQRRHPELLSLPMILTEGGVDQSGNPQTSGWQARGDAAKYQNWLNWFDNQIRQDAYILGVTLFQSGDAAGWPSFEIEPVAGWIAQHLRSAR